MWFSIFHSVSAFCNAGFDIIGDGKSMLSYRHDPLVLCTLAILVAIGGLGFIVWEDIIAKKSWKRLKRVFKSNNFGTDIFYCRGYICVFHS